MAKLIMCEHGYVDDSLCEKCNDGAVSSAPASCYKGVWMEVGMGKFVVQYQALQNKFWYDDPYFNKYATVKRAKKELNEHKNSALNYRIVFRKTVQKQISL